jgi:hypothetical protein
MLQVVLGHQLLGGGQVLAVQELLEMAPDQLPVPDHTQHGAAPARQARLAGTGRTATCAGS